MNKRIKTDSTMMWIQKKNHKRAKLRAVEREMMLTDLLDEIFDFYFEAHPDKKVAVGSK